jgi:hypothetical protein
LAREQVDSEHCLAALLLWAAPFICSLLKVLAGTSLHFIAAADMNGGGKPDLQNTRIYLIVSPRQNGFRVVGCRIRSARLVELG